MNKKLLVGGMILGAVLLTGCGKKPVATETGPTPRAKKVDVNVNLEPIANRPYVLLSPRSDGHAVTMALVDLKKKSTDMEYEIEYNSGTLLQGAFGQATLTGASFPLTKEILLGSCSTGGKCTYNTDVTGGTLTLRFTNPDYTLKQDWSFNTLDKTTTTFTSRDGKIVVDTTGAKVKAVNAVVYQSPGYSGTLAGTIVSGPYTVGLNGPITGNVSVTMRLSADNATGVSLFGYDGVTWKDLAGKITDSQITAKTTLMQAYAVVKK